MGKPEDIPQDVWSAAEGVWIDLANMHRSRDQETSLLARSIIAAKALGYREVADMADAYADVEDVSAIHAATEESNHYHRVAETTLRAFSTAVRARGDTA